MLAGIEKSENGYIAQFERPLDHPVEKVWEALTQNKMLEKWFPNLHVKDLRKEGVITFNMNDGTGSSFEMKITDFQENSILEYEWGDGRVRFELSPQSNGCLLVLKEFINTLTDHIPKDLSGWHVCLDVLAALLTGKVIEFPKGEWEKLYEQYIREVNQVREKY